MLGFTVWSGLVVYTALVFWVSLITPSAKVASLIGPYDKIIHFAMYVLLYFLAASAFRRSPLRRIGYLAAWALVYSALIGAATELLQGTVPARSASFTDWVADTAGAAASMIFLWFNRKKLSQEGYF